MSSIATGSASAKQPAGKAAWIVLMIAWATFIVPIPGIGLFIGWPLNLVAFVLAIVAMAKGGAMKGIFQLIASLVASPIIYFIGVAIFAGTVSKGSYDNYKERAQAAQASASAQEAVDGVRPAADAIKVTASELHSAYESNEIKADSTYKGKPILISGTVDSIESDLTDDAVVQLAAGDFAFVQLKGIDKVTAGNLSKGQQVTAACTGAGEVIGFPMADHCTLR